MPSPPKEEDSGSNDDSTKEYICELCDRSFDSEKGLKIHKTKKHSSEVCSYCGEPFGVEMPFTCKYCGEKFCGEHRLPENHECEEVEKEKEKVKKGKKLMFPKKSKKVEKKTQKPTSSVPTSSFDFKSNDGLKNKIKSISWGKILITLIIVFVFLSIWKPAKVKELTPDPASPYVSKVVDYSNSFVDKTVSIISSDSESVAIKLSGAEVGKLAKGKNFDKYKNTTLQLEGEILEKTVWKSETIGRTSYYLLTDQGYLIQIGLPAETNRIIETRGRDNENAQPKAKYRIVGKPVLTNEIPREVVLDCDKVTKIAEYVPSEGWKRVN
ncbi:hypothetical protein AKJ50_00560 [candidate division MSBL1 archaeon SCGC-AAA382A13]|uniref:AN1-type domain-containing protein n=1 Tax=candidate division MSBL1 archaeon SCGC-AAA382A13 TaxID=1698279 RepID=A0A133VGL9_9EURY|nr:hypothetical protein AKJ50_00560 [candidate division MSBL1 archaeon SCGC-AAA382A13]